MNAIADDYETLEYITDWTERLLMPQGVENSREEVVEALREIIDDGMARAYELSPHPPHSKSVRFSVDRAGKLWFYLTPKGLAACKHDTKRAAQTRRDKKAQPERLSE